MSCHFFCPCRFFCPLRSFYHSRFFDLCRFFDLHCFSGLHRIFSQEYGWNKRIAFSQFPCVCPPRCYKVKSLLNHSYELRPFILSPVEAVGKRPSASLSSSLITAVYFHVRLIPRDFGSLASGHFHQPLRTRFFDSLVNKRCISTKHQVFILFQNPESCAHYVLCGAGKAFIEAI